MVFARIWARFAHLFIGCPLSPLCQQKLFARSVDYGDFFLELLQYSCYTESMPRRIRDYLDRLSHRNTHMEEPNTYTVNTTVNLNDWQPVRWNATQWFPDNNTGETTRQMLENAYNNMTVRDYEEIASSPTPESMLRLVRLAMPNITRNELIHETPMEVLENDWGAEAISRATRIPASYFSANEEEVYRPNRNVVYSEYTPSWSNRTINWWANDKGHVEFRRGRIIRVKRYCKI